MSAKSRGNWNINFCTRRKSCGATVKECNACVRFQNFKPKEVAKK